MKEQRYAMAKNNKGCFMETWICWQPINNLSGKYYVDTFVWSETWDLIVTLSNKDSKHSIKVTFYRLVDAFRRSDKDFCLKMLHDLSSRYGDDFYNNWSFFKVTNSNYLQWLSEKSRTYSDYFPFQHFCIIGGNEIIDVLAQKEPEVIIVLSEKVV